MVSDSERKGMDAFLQATAAARNLTAAIETARVFGVILTVDITDAASAGEPSPEVRVCVAGPGEIVADKRATA